MKLNENCLHNPSTYYVTGIKEKELVATATNMQKIKLILLHSKTLTKSTDIKWSINRYAHKTSKELRVVLLLMLPNLYTH